MSTRTNPPTPQGRFTFSTILTNGQLAWRLMQDDRVPTFLKVAIPLVVAAYFLFPVDLIPDFIPGLGQLDDLGVILLGISLFINLAPRDVVIEHRVGMGLEAGPRPGADAGPPTEDRPTTVIDGTYHSTDDRR